jgi:hypothetical protein
VKVDFELIGDWDEGSVDIRWSDDKRPRIAEIEEAIESAWGSAMQRPKEGLGVKLFDGPMCRLESAAGGERLQLTLSPTSYKAFLGTNLTHPEFAELYGSHVLANPVGLSCALVSSDDYVLLGRRNPKVAYYPGRIHPFAGALEPSPEVSVFDEVRRELAEELGFTVGETREISCLGLVRDGSLLQPELVFRAISTQSRGEIEARVLADEHEGALAVASTAEAVSAAALDPRLTPVAVGALLLFGRGRFGEPWFDAAGRAVNLPGNELY